MRKSSLLRSVAVAGLAISLVACGGTSFEDSDNDDDQAEANDVQAETIEGTVRLLVNVTPNLTKSYWEGQVAKFNEEYPDIEVRIEAPVGRTAAEQLTQQLATGNPPDVVQSVPADPKTASVFVDLTDEDWVRDTPLAEDYAVDGRIYSPGVGVQIHSLVFYNKQAFDEAGVEAPLETLDDFEDAMVKLKAAGYLPLQTAGEWVTGSQFSALTNASLLLDHPDWYVQRAAGETSFEDEAYVSYLERYDRWIDEGLVSEDALGVKYADAEAQFLSGRSAMYNMGSWFTAAEANATTDFEIGVFPAPGVDTYPTAQLATLASTYAITEDSENKDAAITLIKWMTTNEDAVRSFIETDGVLRAGITYDTTPLGDAVAEILDAAPQSVVVRDGDGVVPDGFGGELGTHVQGLYVGESPSDIAQALDEWWDGH